MKSTFSRLILLPILVLIAAALACDFPGQSEISAADLASTQTLEAVATMVAQTLQAGEGDQAPPAPTATPEVADAQPTTTPTPEIVHLTQPSNPSGISSFMTDRSTRSLAPERRAIADNFDANLYERPFTAEIMDYKEHLDITRGELDLEGAWVYVTIFLEGPAPSDSEVMYAVEIDLDIDGRGDVFIGGLVPPGTDWTTDGVRAWKDSNNDVGGMTPIYSDNPQPAWDGYDNLVFDQGLGPDPDVAWIRRAPGQSDRVQLAFKFSLIDSDGNFMWGVWADEGVKDPGKLDYNDAFTHEQAGSPAIESSLYPLQELALVDNSCRWGVGFTPNGTEPGVCYIPPTPTNTPVPPPTRTPTLEPPA